MRKIVKQDVLHVADVVSGIVFEQRKNRQASIKELQYKYTKRFF